MTEGTPISKPSQPAPTQEYFSSAAWLAYAYAGLVIYASLYPFTGWRIGSVGVWVFWSQKFPAYWTYFDLITNFAGYIPLGFLVGIALVRHLWSPPWATLLAVVLGAMLSMSLEFLQNFLPQRVPSNLDGLLNTSGAFCGAVIGWLVCSFGGINWWQMVRKRWFSQPSAGGIFLLCVWLLGLLFPLPYPFAMGQILVRAREFVLGLSIDTSLDSWVQVWIPVFPLRPFTTTGEFVLIALGLLGPCCLALTVAAHGWRCRVFLLFIVVMGLLTTSLSSALSFGPEHAWSWATHEAWRAMMAALGFALIFSCTPRRWVAAIGLISLAALIFMVSLAPSDPFFALNLQSWEQGRFIRFYGAAQWVGWLWPFAAMVYLAGAIFTKTPK